MADIPAEEIEWVKQVVELAEDKLKVEFSPNIYLTLTDHLHYAITRAKKISNCLIHYYLKQKILSERISSSERGSFVRETKDGCGTF